ncbi:MAG: hypothetical protein JWP61_35, partial [Friedmanniella sp.]|nr:hypothetical protein [Friedmanniella sp.]
DVDRAATRMFKLSRMAGPPDRVSKPAAYEVPADLDLRELARSLGPQEPTGQAVLAVRHGKAPSLSRRGEPTTPGVVLPNGFTAYAVGYADLRGAAEEIGGFAADVLVLEPVELRDLVLGRLRAVAATASRTAEPTGQGAA